MFESRNTCHLAIVPRSKLLFPAKFSRADLVPVARFRLWESTQSVGSQHIWTCSAYHPQGSAKVFLDRLPLNLGYVSARITIAFNTRVEVM